MHSTYVIGIYLNYTLIEIRGKLCTLVSAASGG